MARFVCLGFCCHDCCYDAGVFADLRALGGKFSCFSVFSYTNEALARVAAAMGPSDGE
jgi:hypothetical protein